MISIDNQLDRLGIYDITLIALLFKNLNKHDYGGILNLCPKSHIYISSDGTECIILIFLSTAGYEQ